jgi:hypothetical protein
MIAEPSMQPFQAFGLNFIFSQGIVIARPVKVDDVAGVRALEERVSGPASLNWLSACLSTLGEITRNRFIPLRALQ